MTMRRRGVELRLILDGQSNEQRQVDPGLAQGSGAGARWFEEVASGGVGSLAEIARREGLRKRYVARLTKLAFIALAIAEAIRIGDRGRILVVGAGGGVELAVFAR